MSITTRVCSQCYTPLTNEEQVCRNCGMSCLEQIVPGTRDTAGFLAQQRDLRTWEQVSQPELENVTDAAPPSLGVPVAPRPRGLKVGLLLGTVFLIAIAVIAGGGVFLLLRESGASTTKSSARAHVATVTPGIGVPVVSGKWEITLEKVHLESELSGQVIGISSNTYTPNSGYTFLVLDIQLQSLDTAKELQVSTDMFAIVSQGGQIATPQLVSSGVVSGYNPGISFITTTSQELSLSLAFVITQESVGQAYKLQFSSVPLIPFSAR